MFRVNFATRHREGGIFPLLRMVYSSLLLGATGIFFFLETSRPFHLKFFPVAKTFKIAKKYFFFNFGDFFPFFNLLSAVLRIQGNYIVCIYYSPLTEWMFGVFI